MPRRRNDNSPYRRQLLQAEKRMIEYAIECGGSLRQAAVLLGVSESFIIGRAAKLGCKRSVKKARTRGPDKARRRPRVQTASNVIQLDAGREPLVALDMGEGENVGEGEVGDAVEDNEVEDEVEDVDVEVEDVEDDEVEDVEDDVEDVEDDDTEDDEDDEEPSNGQTNIDQGSEM